jgi:hypothetical protein
MKNVTFVKYLLLILLSVFTITSELYAQRNTNCLEIEPFIRWDKYPTFTNDINVIARYQLAIRGRSWGINTNYKIVDHKKRYFKFGLGYYRYSFNQIISTHRTFGEGDRRVIDYPTTLGLVLVTDRYSYNTINMNLGIGNHIKLNKEMNLLFGANFKNHFTFSQYYHLPYDNSFIPQRELQIKNNYKTFKKRYFGLGADLNIGILKSIGDLNIGPNLIIPVYDNWRQDDIFPTENNSASRNKWFSGIGVGIICNYPIGKTKNYEK